MNLRSSSIHGLHALLLAVAVAGAIPYGWHAAGSLALGGVIQVLNLRLLERSVRLIIGTSVEGGRGTGLVVHAAAALRLLLFFAAVAWVLTQTRVEPLAFGAGLLLVLPALTWHTLRRDPGPETS
jgi:hypothetical protein